jgi:hypothetical protein
MKDQLDFSLLESKDPKIKYGFAKELLQIAKCDPGVLIPYLDVIIQHLNNKNNIIKWTAIDLIGYLSAEDNTDKTRDLIPDLVTLLHGGHLITTNHCIFALGKIADNKPEYKEYILQEFLKITNDTFDTEECKHIAVGKVLDVLKPDIKNYEHNKKVVSFIKKASVSTRNATLKKALLLLNKIYDGKYINSLNEKQKI